MDAIAFTKDGKIKGWFNADGRANIKMKSKPVYFDPSYIALYTAEIKEFAKTHGYGLEVRPKLFA